MPETDPFLRFLASWALVHETADEGWKAAVERGQDLEPGAMSEGPAAFVEGLSAIVAEEKEKLKAEIAAGQMQAPGTKADVSDKLDELSFEVSELRGRLESLQASLDALVRRDEQ